MKKIILLTIGLGIILLGTTACGKKERKSIDMKDKVYVDRFDDYISITLYIEDKEIYDIGEKMNIIDSRAYMNGYNWNAFLNYYLKKSNPVILEGLQPDPEAGMYAAYYDYSEENLEKANTYKAIIVHLLENEDEIYTFLKKEKKNINWD